MQDQKAVAAATPVARSLNAREHFESIGSALAGCQAFGVVDAIGVLRNLHDVGVSAPVALEALSERLEDRFVGDDGLAGDELTRAFTVQIAQHYIDDARASVEAAAVAVESAMNALISLLEES